MHVHDLDIASVFLTNTRTISTFWEESPRSDRPGSAPCAFDLPALPHATANQDISHFLSVIVEFTRSQGRPDSSEAGTLFCLTDACVLDMTVPPGDVWTAAAPVLVVPLEFQLDAGLRRNRATPDPGHGDGGV